MLQGKLTKLAVQIGKAGGVQPRRTARGGGTRGAGDPGAGPAPGWASVTSSARRGACMRPTLVCPRQPI